MNRDQITVEPLFKSGHDACRFAYAFSSQQYAMTAMAKMMKGSTCGSGKGLVGLDGAAVAGTIKRHVEYMSIDHHAAILARYELNRGNALAGVVALIKYVIPALGTGGHHTHMVRGLICRYFKIPGNDGRQYQLSVLCDQFGVSADTMTRRWKATRDRLREIESKAQREIDDVLQNAGLVE